MFSHFYRKSISVLLITTLVYSLVPISYASTGVVIPESIATSTGTVVLDTGMTTTGSMDSGSISTGTLLSSLVSTDTGSVDDGSTGVVISTGVLATGSGSSGSNIVPSIDYTKYSYYSGTWTQNGVTYGNSFYLNSLGLGGGQKGIQIYTYDQYIALQNTTKTIASKKSAQKQASTIQTQSAMTVSALSGPISGLVAEYLFDGNANDTSTNAFTGYAMNISWQTFNSRSSAVFGGPNNPSMLAINPAVVNGAPEITVSTWITWSDLNSNLRGILGNQGNYAGDLHYQYYSPNGNDLAIAFYVAGATDVYAYKNLGNIQTNQWYMLTTTYDQVNGTLKYYLNGSLIGNQIFGYIPLISIWDLAIGNTYDTIRYHSGNLAGFQIYNRVLSASEIQTLYSNQVASCTDGILNQNETSIDLGGVCANVPRNGLVAEYLLDGNANDTGPNGNHGIAANMSWIDSGRGDNRQVAQFNGFNSSITHNNPIGLARSNGQEMAINAWIKWGGGSGYQDIATIRGNSGHNWIFYKHIDGDKLSFHGEVNQFKGNHSVIPGQWAMVTATVNSGGLSQVFMNGSLVDSFTGYTFGSTYSNVLNIGSGIPYNEYFSGAISDLRIYNRVLSASEIQTLYTGLPPAPPVSNNTNFPYINPSFVDPFTTFIKTGNDNHVTASNTVNINKDADPGTLASKNNSLGDPVNLATGEFAYDNTLMNIPGVGSPYQLNITYKNQATYNGPLGFNWDHSYNQYLSGETNGNVLYYNGQLGTFRFIQSGATWLRNEGLRASLSLSGGLYVINYDSGKKAYFNTDNRLSRLVDTNNNAMNLVYSGSYLSGVVDTLGRTISYSYYDHNRLRSVTDFTGRKAEFIYYTGATASGNLYDLANIVLTNSGVTKTIGFEYSTDLTDPLSHNITRLIDAKGQVYVENTYTPEDRVATQKYGSASLGYTYTLSGSQITQNTVLDKLGNRTDYAYDGSGNNTSIRYYNPAQTGSVLYTYTYNTLGLMTREKRPRGNGYTYSYDTKGNLLQKRFKTNADAVDSSTDLVTTYTYNARNEKMTETAPNNTQVIYTRDPQGNILTETQSGSVNYNGATITGITRNNIYYSGGLLKSTTSPEGKPTIYMYSSGQITKLVRGTGSSTSTGSFVYSPYGTVLSATDGDGFTKNYGYTVFDLVSTGTTAEGIVTGYLYDANNNKTRETHYLTGATASTIYTYDSLDHLTSTLADTQSGQTLLMTYTYDNNGNITDKKIGNGATVHYTYNEFSKPLEERILLVPGDTSQDIITSYAYDTNNNLISKTDPRGYITTYTYDLYDRVITETNPQGTYTTYSYNQDNTVDTTSTYTSIGLILTRNKTLYDKLGHIIKSTNYLTPATSTNPVEKKYLYNKDFEVYYSINENGSITANYYDYRGNKIQSTDPLNNLSLQNYNKRDIVNAISVFGNNASNIQTTYLIDRDGRTTRSTNYLGKYTSYIYDNLGSIVKSTDEMGRITDIVRDYRGLMTRQTTYSGAITSITNYTYDERGNLTSITDPISRTTSYQYDGINRNTRITYPDLKTVVMTYDKASNLLTKTDPNGTVVTNSYNLLNQLISRSVTTGSGILGVTNEIYTYDALGRLTSAGDNTNPTGTGAPTYSGVAVTNLTFTYDALSRLKTETQKPIGGTVYTMAYGGYNPTGDLTSFTMPDNRYQTYTYDALHRPLDVGYAGSLETRYTYTGIVLSNLYSGGKNTTYTYDAINRLTTINAGTGIPLPTYTYNDASDILTDGTKSYTYDGLARLIRATPSISGALIENYVYDKTGNRTNSTLNIGTTSYYVNTLDQYVLITAPSGISTTPAFDANGNLKSEGNKTYTYDYNNRLIQVNSGASILAKYTYDILGRRTQKIDYSKSSSNPEKIVYVYTKENLLMEYKTIGVLVNGTGTLTPLTLAKRYINSIGTDAVIGYDAEEQISPTSTGITTTRYQYHKNQLGSIIALTKGPRTLIQKYSYDSYGKAYVYSGTTLIPISSYTGNTYSNTRLYTGREYDKETNLYYLRARYYNSDTGRFLQRDPVGQSDQVNLYTYVANSPLKYVDRMGKEKVLIITGRIRNDPEQQDLFNTTYLNLASNRVRNGLTKSNLVYITDVDTPEEFNEKVKPYLGNIKEVIYIQHGSQGESAGSITKDNFQNLNSLKIDSNDNPSMLLISCQAGRGGNTSIAQDMSNRLGITVQASSENVNSNISPHELDEDNFNHKYGEPYPANNGSWIYFKPNY